MSYKKNSGYIKSYIKTGSNVTLEALATIGRIAPVTSVTLNLAKRYINRGCAALYLYYNNNTKVTIFNVTDVTVTRSPCYHSFFWLH